MFKMFKMFRNQKGFTIIELVIVMLILGVLAMVLIPKNDGNKVQAKIFTDTQSIKIINDAIAMHTASNGMDSLVGLTSISVVQPIKNGDSVTTIITFLKDKGMLDEKAQVFLPQGHTYNSLSNTVN